MAGPWSTFIQSTPSAIYADYMQLSLALSPTDDTPLETLHWLLKAMLLGFKSLNGLGPSHLSDMFQKYTPSRALVQTTVKSRICEAALSCYAAKLEPAPTGH